MNRRSNALVYQREGQYLVLGFLFLVFIFGWCVLAHSAEVKPAPVKEKPDVSSFIEIKNKTPEQMFTDANYLYHLGEYESALILYNKVASETNDKDLKRRANMAREIIDILMKAERIGGKQGAKETKRADKIKSRQKQDQISYLYKEAYSRFFSKNYDQASEIFKAIISIDPQQKEARYYFQDRIPQVIREDRVKTLYREALQDFGVQDYEKAAKLFNEILAIPPDRKEVKNDIETKLAFILKQEKIKNLYSQATAAFDGSNFDGSAKLFKEIVELDPDQDKAGEYLEVSIPQKLKEQRVAALYKEALNTFNNQEYDKAKQTFYDILSLDLKQAEAKEYVEVKIPAMIKEQKIKGLLEEGTAAFDDKDYDKATGIFNKILALDAAQPQAVEYVQVKIPDGLKQLKIKGIYKEAVEYFSVADYERSDTLFRDILALDSNQPEAREYVEAKIPEKLKALKVNALYSEALGDFNDRDYMNATEKFKEILALSPEEREAKEFLETKIPAVVKEEKVRGMYAQAIDAFDNGDFQRANEIFKGIIAEDPAQDKAKDYLEAKIPQKIAEAKIQDLYKGALIAFNNEEYEAAIKYFEQILAIDPKQQTARAYLEDKIPEKLKLAKEEQERARQAQLEREQELEKERLAQIERRKQAEREHLALIERQREIENERLAEIERQRQAEEREHLAEIERERQVEGEHLAEIERQMQVERERLAQMERQRQEERARLAGEERQRLIERERLAQIEIQKQRQKSAALLAKKEKEQQPPYQQGQISPKPKKEAALKTEPKKYISTDRKPKYIQDGVIGLLYDRAFSAYDEGDYTAAQDYFSKILTIDPTESVAKEYLDKVTKENG
jgi:tetratricopeptide (TPR) repeat protein